MHGSLYSASTEEGTSIQLGSQCTLSTLSVPASTLQEDESLKSDIHKLNMHITAAKPSYHKVTDVPSDVVDHEKEIILKQMDDNMKQKPEKVLEKIVGGKMNKFFQEVVLEEQTHMLSEDNVTVCIYVHHTLRHVHSYHLSFFYFLFFFFFRLSKN